MNLSSKYAGMLQGGEETEFLITEMLNFNVMGPSFTSLIVLEVPARSLMLIKIRLVWTWVAVKSF